VSHRRPNTDLVLSHSLAIKTLSSPEQDK